MTAINFPTNPQAGDTFLNYAYDGEKWKSIGGASTSVVLRDLFSFSVAADDSTSRIISTDETIKFIGVGGITTASDTEGNITITQGTVSYNDLTNKPTIPTAVSQLTNDSGYLTTASSLTNGSDTLSLNGANKVDLPGGTAFIFSAANNISLFSDLSGSNYLEIINNVGAILSTDRAFEIRTNTDGTDRTWSFTQGGTLFFPDSTAQTTAYSTNAARALFSAANASASGSGGSLSYSSGVFTFTPALNIAGNAATVTNGVYTTGSYADPNWITSLAYSKLTGTPTIPTTTSELTNNSGYVTASAIPAQFTFNVAADDSTLRTISSEETVKFIGAGGITTSSDAEGAITITAGGTTTLGTSTLTIGGTTTGLGGLTSIDATLSASSFFATPNSTVNLFAAASTVNIGKTTGTLSAQNIITIPEVASVTNNSATNKYLGIGSHGQLFDDGNFHIHTTSGAVWINSLDSGNIKLGTQYNSGSGSDVDIGKNLIVNSGSVTANATTSFIAGSNAVSGVALQMPSEAALRNLTNGSTNMYFDVSIGGSTQGQFQFRSSSSYTNVLTMSSTGVTFNTDATFTSRTPSLARTAFNAAIDTEITVDNMRFRISNQGGIFPQVIGNGSSRNLAWTGVGAISGSAVAQVGSTGTIVSTSAWTTLYNSHGMDSAGDTVTVTLQDKAAGRIYRITFMRSDNGSTTGYNIIGERIL